jgi:hypothetical protein
LRYGTTLLDVDLSYMSDLAYRNKCCLTGVWRVWRAGVAEVGQRGRLAGLVEELVVVVDLACGVQEEELDAG